MRPRLSWIWCWIIGAVLASGVGAQQYTTIIDNLPTCTGNRNGRVISVSDAVSDTDCTTGGATGTDRFVHQCICDTLNALGPYWKAVGGGAGGGVSGLSTADGGTALSDNAIVRGDGTTGVQGSTVTVADSTGNLQWEGTTADAFEGNFTFADPTADWTWAWGATGNVTIPGNIQGPTAGFTLFGGTSTTADLTFQTTTGVGATGSDMHFLVGDNGAIEALKIQHDGFLVVGGASANIATPNGGIWNGTAQNAGIYLTNDNRLAIYVAATNMILGWKKNGASDWRTAMRADGSLVWVSSGDPYNAENADTTLFRSAAGIVGVGGTSTSVGAALHLVPLASPPRTCDATAEGDLYSDTSHALCWCDASAWQKLSGAGTCA